MQKYNRSPKPLFLDDCKEDELSEDIKKQLRKILSNNSNDCCAYCDAGNILATCSNIEHFFPKANFPSLSTKWENLFLSCQQCNLHKSTKYYGVDEFGKIGKLEFQPLKPDEKDYYFENHFTINILTGEIVVKNNNKNSKTTIDFFELNRPDLNSARKRELENYRKTKSYFNYSSYIEEFKRIENEII